MKKKNRHNFQMKILTTGEASLENLSKLSLDNPEKVKDLFYLSIKYESDFFYLQTPRMYVTEDPIGHGINLIFDNKKSGESLRQFYKSFRDIEKKICKLVSDGSESWFSKKITQKETKELFKTSLVLPQTLDDKITLNIQNGINFEIYNQKKNKIELNALKPNMEVITLLLPNELVITSTSFYIVWEIAQMKVYQSSKKIKGYGIRNEPDSFGDLVLPKVDVPKVDVPRVDLDLNLPTVILQKEVESVTTGEKKLNVNLIEDDSESDSYDGKN